MQIDGCNKGDPLTRSVGLSQVDFDFKLIFFNLGWFSMSFVFWGKETKGIRNQHRLNQNSPEIKYEL